MWIKKTKSQMITEKIKRILVLGLTKSKRYVILEKTKGG